MANGYAKGFASGSVFSGWSKGVCLPGLNCSSCPAALTSCPLGMLQQTLANRGGSLYVLGFLTLFGALVGRLVCGFLCPFGLIQELLFAIPFPFKRKNLPLDRYLRWIKYVLLFGFVIILPLVVMDEFGYGEAWFCKYVCPAGTLEAGLPLSLLDEGIRSTLSFLFAWKVTILVILIILSLLVYRPFCKYLCPLGLIYGFFNKVSLYRYSLDEDACIHCGKCKKTCPMGVDMTKDQNSIECIRCGECISACPVQAISRSLDAKIQSRGFEKKPQE